MNIRYFTEIMITVVVNIISVDHLIFTNTCLHITQSTVLNISITIRIMRQVALFWQKCYRQFSCLFVLSIIVVKECLWISYFTEMIIIIVKMMSVDHLIFKNMSAYHTIYSLEHVDYSKNYDTVGSLLIKMLQTIQLPVCIVYNGCGGVFLNIRYFTEIMITVMIMMFVEHLKLKKHSSADHTVYLHLGIFSKLFSIVILFHFSRGVLRI